MDDHQEELSRIAAEQRREFTVARIVESDLDLAFRLQLEEAISASIAFQPPASTSRDRVLIEAETKKVQVDFHRRIHDQKLAREILHMPEEQWRVLGGNIERPFGEGSSSSKNQVDSQVFRVYFKGLLSEERVRGIGSSQETVTLAGIGVAICDSKDELIFETSKPLYLSEDDGMSRQSVEGKALIEALNAAIALDLKRIVFCCDYYTLYQHVSGRWQPRQEKIRTLVNDVNLLRKSFTDCVPSLVARNDVKFAFKLASEAILSQINNPVESSHDKLENCVICLDDKSMDQFFSIEGCKHRYCFSCMKQHVEVKLLHGMVPKCPHEGCQSELKIESCEIFMTPKLIEMMEQRLKEDSIPVTEKVYCPYPKCSTLMSKDELLRLPRSIYESGARTCYKCHGNLCINCWVPWHTNMSCAEYKRRNPAPFVEESKLKNLAARNLWRQCIKCKHMIELAAGCYHMTCRCGYEFCYNCGAEWKNKKATCNCPLWIEENIVNAEEDAPGENIVNAEEDAPEEDIVDAEEDAPGEDIVDAEEDAPGENMMYDEQFAPAWLGFHIVNRRGDYFDDDNDYNEYDYEYDDEFRTEYI